MYVCQHIQTDRWHDSQYIRTICPNSSSLGPVWTTPTFAEPCKPLILHKWWRARSRRETNTCIYTNTTRDVSRLHPIYTQLEEHLGCYPTWLVSHWNTWHSRCCPYFRPHIAVFTDPMCVQQQLEQRRTISANQISRKRNLWPTPHNHTYRLAANRTAQKRTSVHLKSVRTCLFTRLDDVCLPKPSNQYGTHQLTNTTTRRVPLEWTVRAECASDWLAAQFPADRRPTSDERRPD